MCGKLEGLALYKDYQRKGHGTKGKAYYGFLKKIFSLLRYPNFLKKDSIFGYTELHK